MAGEIKAEANLPQGRYKITWEWYVSASTNIITTDNTSNAGSICIFGNSGNSCMEDVKARFSLNPNFPAVFAPGTPPAEWVPTKSVFAARVVTTDLVSSGGWVQIADYRPCVQHKGDATGTTTESGQITIFFIDKTSP